MRQKAKVILPLISLIALTSCGGTNKVVVPINFDLTLNQEVASARELTTSTLVNMLNNDSTFVLYMYSPNCGICSYVKTYFENIQKTNPLTYYQYNVTENISTYPQLSNYDNEIFPSGYVSTPRVLLFENGDFELEVNSSKFNKESYFKNTLFSFVKTHNNLYSFSTLNSYQHLIENETNNLFISYNSSNEESASKFNKDIYPLLVENNKLNIYIFDTVFLNEETLNYIKVDLNVENIDNIFFTNKNHVKDYLNVANFDELIEYISPQL